MKNQVGSKIKIYFDQQRQTSSNLPSSSHLQRTYTSLIILIELQEFAIATKHWVSAAISNGIFCWRNGSLKLWHCKQLVAAMPVLLSTTTAWWVCCDWNYQQLFSPLGLRTQGYGGWAEKDRASEDHQQHKMFFSLLGAMKKHQILWPSLAYFNWQKNKRIIAAVST